MRRSEICRRRGPRPTSPSLANVRQERRRNLAASGVVRISALSVDVSRGVRAVEADATGRSIGRREADFFMRVKPFGLAGLMCLSRPWIVATGHKVSQCGHAAPYLGGQKCKKIIPRQISQIQPARRWNSRQGSTNWQCDPPRVHGCALFCPLSPYRIEGALTFCGNWHPVLKPHNTGRQWEHV